MRPLNPTPSVFPRRHGAFARLGAVALAVALTACGRRDGVLARVGSEAVTVEDFRREAAGRPYGGAAYLETLPGRKEMLELLVRRRVVMAEAKRAAFARRPDVRKRLDEIEAELARQREEARDRVVIGEFFRFLQERDLKVTDAEVRDFWSTANEVKAAHILVSDAAKADDILARLKKGESFEALAKKYSEDPTTGRQGGELGYILPGTLVPEFETALFALKTGETSAVVETPYGRHVIRKLDERPLAAQPFEQSAERARSVLEKRKFQAWLDQARSRYRISTDVAALEDLKLSEAAPPAADAAPAAP